MSLGQDDAVGQFLDGDSRASRPRPKIDTTFYFVYVDF